MKSLKDFYYDKNDIIIALLILCIAGLIITWRMDVIMDYPQTLAKETDTVQTTEEDAITTSDASDSGDTASDNTDHVWMAGELTHEVTVVVSGGSAVAAVETLVNAGLFESYEEFSEVCESAGCAPEDIKANTFTFEKGSTQTEIAKKVTS